MKPGSLLADRYELGELLSESDLAQVYAARDRKTQSEVAVRVFVSNDREAVDRVIRQAMAMRVLQHPNLVAVLDAGEADGCPYLVTEPLRGETLQALLARGPLPVVQAQLSAQQLAAGLAAAHDKGFTHGALKTSSIFITGDGWLKILDFGFAGPTDPRADLFDFGRVFSDMLAGQAAPAALRQLIDRCLQKDPAKRPASADEVLEALQEVKAAPKQMLRWKKIAVLAAVAAAALFVAIRSADRPRVTAPVVGSVAILRFDVRDAPRFAPLADGIGLLLARDLEGTSLRAVEAPIKPGKSEPVSDLDQARAEAVQSGANYFVLGRIENRGGDLIFGAVLYSAETGEPLLTAGARGRSSEVLLLVRKLSDRLQNVTRTPQDFDARLADLTRRTSRSVDALLAWLEGESLWRRGHFWDRAGDAFQRAVAADREFALAYYRLGIVMPQWQPGLSEDSLARALQLADRLPVTERTLVEAHFAVQRGDLTEAQRLLEMATRDNPADAEVLMELADFQFHQGPLKGRSPQDAESALQRVIVLDPENIEALSHLVDLAQLRGDRAIVSTLTERVLRLTDDPIRKMDFGLLHAWARGDTAERDALLAELRAPSAVPQIILNAMNRTAWEMDGSGITTTIAAWMPYKTGLQPLASSALLAGRFDAARKAVTGAVASHPSGGDDYYLPWIDTLEFAYPTPQQLKASRAAAEHLKNVDANREPARKFLVGLLALQAADISTAAAAASELKALDPIGGSSIAADLSLSLQARILAAKQDYVGALALMDQQEVRLPNGLAIFYGRASDNFFRASILEALGRPREALPLYEALAFYTRVDPTYLAASNLHRARIYEKLGDSRKAIERYEAFAALWKNCEAPQRELLATVQKRLTELRAVQH